MKSPFAGFLLFTVTVALAGGIRPASALSELRPAVARAAFPLVGPDRSPAPPFGLLNALATLENELEKGSRR